PTMALDAMKPMIRAHSLRASGFSFLGGFRSRTGVGSGSASFMGRLPGLPRISTTFLGNFRRDIAYTYGISESRLHQKHQFFGLFVKNWQIFNRGRVRE